MRTQTRARFRYSMSSSGATWMPYWNAAIASFGLADVDVQHAEVVDGRGIVAPDGDGQFEQLAGLVGVALLGEQQPESVGGVAVARIDGEQRGDTVAPPRRRCPASRASAPH